MAIEWGIGALIIKLISLIRGRKRSIYFNHKRDELVYSLAEKLNVTNILLLTGPQGDNLKMEEININPDSTKIPFLRFRKIGSKEYQKLLEPYFKKSVLLSEDIFRWADLNALNNTIYLPPEIKKALKDLDFSNESADIIPAGKNIPDAVRLSLNDHKLNDTMHELPVTQCRNFEDYYNRLVRLKKAILKVSYRKLNFE